MGDMCDMCIQQYNHVYAHASTLADQKYKEIRFL